MHSPTDSYKFIRTHGSGPFVRPPCELYDLAAHRAETVNLADTRPELSEVLERQLGDWIAGKLDEDELSIWIYVSRLIRPFEFTEERENEMKASRLFALEGQFFIGCNYWASHAGTAMWSDWHPEIVEADLKRLATEGLGVLRVFPLWPDFQPIEEMYGPEGQKMGVRFGETHVPTDEWGQAGMSADAMKKFGQLCDIAERAGLRLIVGLVTGYMSGRLFVPPALRGRPILTDPTCIKWQVKFVRTFVRTFKDTDTIIAWDLGNECNVMGQVEHRDQAWLWTAALANAIKAEDTTRPLISGMHSLLPNSNWTMQDQGELTDILTTHPYPYWTPYSDVDPFTTMRPLLHATAESLFYADIGGKVCFVEEIGTMGPMVGQESYAARFARASLLTQWAHGLPGMLWWCAFDQTRLDHAPYDWSACEGELGLITEDGRAKPVIQEIARTKQKLDALPFDTLPAHKKEAVCILTGTQDQWAVAYSSFILAKQAGFDLSYQYENQPLKDANLYLVPSITSCWGIPKPLWKQLLNKVEQGAALYLSIDDGYILEFERVTGLRVKGRSRRGSTTEVTLSSGEAITLGGSFRFEVETDHAEILGREKDGNPVFTKAAYGLGTVYFLSFPLEAKLASMPEAAYRPEQQPYYRIYEIFSETVRQDRALPKLHPLVGVTEHEFDANRRLAVLINYTSDTVEYSLSSVNGWTLAATMYGTTIGEQDQPSARIAPNDAWIAEFQR